MYFNNRTYLFINGNFHLAKEAGISPYTQSLHYGYAVFEGIRAYATTEGTHIFKAEAHFERLLNSANLLHMNTTYNVEELISISYKLLKKNNLTNAYLRPVIYVGEQMTLRPSAVAHLMICTWRWAKYFGDQTLNLKVSKYAKISPKAVHVEAKVSGHYVNNILASQEVRSAGYDEALMLDEKGFVAQAPGANFFFEKDGTLYTAPEGAIFSGITRQTILEIAKELGIEVKQKHFKPEELGNIDAAFLTGTATEVAQIATINDVKMKLTIEQSLGTTIAEAYRKRVRTQHQTPVI